MRAGDGRETLQVRHGEDQRTVHQAVDHQPMLTRIDLRNIGATGGPHEVKRGRRNHPDRILKGSRHVKHEPKAIGRRPTARRVRDADRGHETGALAVSDQVVAAPDKGLWPRELAERGLRGSPVAVLVGGMTTVAPRAPAAS